MEYTWHSQLSLKARKWENFCIHTKLHLKVELNWAESRENKKKINKSSCDNNVKLKLIVSERN